MKADFNLSNGVGEDLRDITDKFQEKLEKFFITRVREFFEGCMVMMHHDDVTIHALSEALKAALPPGRDWQKWIEDNVIDPAYSLVKGDVNEEILDSMDGPSYVILNQADDIGRSAVESLLAELNQGKGSNP
jgi:hypothetical protein